MPSTFSVPAAKSGMACASGGPPMTGMSSPAPLSAFIIASACGAVIMRASASALALVTGRHDLGGDAAEVGLVERPLVLELGERDALVRSHLGAVVERLLLDREDVTDADDRLPALRREDLDQRVGVVLRALRVAERPLVRAGVALGGVVREHARHAGLLLDPAGHRGDEVHPRLQDEVDLVLLDQLRDGRGSLGDVGAVVLGDELDHPLAVDAALGVGLLDRAHGRADDGLVRRGADAGRRVDEPDLDGAAGRGRRDEASSVVVPSSPQPPKATAAATMTTSATSATAIHLRLLITPPCVACCPLGNVLRVRLDPGSTPSRARPDAARRRDP